MKRVSNPLRQKILTKGDNNSEDDIGLYRGREWLDREHIIGKVSGYAFSSPTCGRHLLMYSRSYDRFIPYVGYVTIAMVCRRIVMRKDIHLNDLSSTERLPLLEVCFDRMPRLARIVSEGITYT